MLAAASLAMVVAVAIRMVPAAAFVVPSSACLFRRSACTSSTSSTTSSTAIFFTALYPWEEDNNPQEGSSLFYKKKDNKEEDTTSLKSYAQEETLLKMHCKVMHRMDLQTEVLPKVQRFVQRFPFHTTVPQQPLQKMPTKDGGVELTFLYQTSTTAVKSNVNGGLRFFLVPVLAESEDADTTTTTHLQNCHELLPTRALAPAESLELVVKRNSQSRQRQAYVHEADGEKLCTAEKAIVTAFVDAFLGKDVDYKYTTKEGPPPTFDAVTVESIFHRWMI